ncbi:MAG: helix-turn-helix transcriptional regulator [Verrucomicrobiae bacterium]|nr:helix-turn-helix transcriptional regulator [Verrucomicrobiae bacterium]
MESDARAELRVTVDLAAGKHYAGDELPLGALMLGIVREGARDVGALLLMPQGLWARYNSGEVRPLPRVAGALWLRALRAKRRLSVEEIGPLAGVRPETFAEWEGGGQAVSVNHIRRLLRALHMDAGP